MTSRLRDTPLSASFTSCAARFVRSSSARSHNPSRSVTQVGVVRCRGNRYVPFRGLRTMQGRRLHVLLHVLRRATNSQLLEEESELLVVRLAQLGANVR